MARAMPHHTTGPTLFQRLFRNTIAVDAGTANTLIYTDDGGIVLNQPSVVCFEKGADANHVRVAAVGSEAKQMLGRAPSTLEAIRPVRHGVIANFSAAEHMIREFIEMSKVRPLFGRAEFTICVPAGATEVERRAIREAAAAAGASKVNLIGESLASAVGAGLPVSSARGSMVVDIGGGTTEVGVIALGGLAYSASVKVGGDQFDLAIVNYVRSLYGVLLGDQTAEHVKKTIGSALLDVPVERMHATGRSAEDGLPRTVELTNHDVTDAIAGPLRQVVEAVKAGLELAPPELVTDIAHHGVTLTGGGSLLRHLDRCLQNEIGIDVRVADEPLTCAVRGAGMAAAMLDAYAFD
ncbi:rod shape-determining protein [Paraburkholderia phosphatilytica]|uniref:rod shape-determining protein n=1 Tax=Paraburkholderia phosphatilytica TaxID=2282883 RepID=UPI000E4AC63E|nr:rod shape-determining protein [Paraburkholderia phosphatilytica]